MPGRATIEDFLAQRELAFVGVSRDPKAFGNVVYRAMRDAGHRLHPVHPTAEVLEGDACVPSLADVPRTVGGVVVLVPADAAVDVVRDALDAGVPRVWLHRGAGPGAVSDEAVRLCAARGVPVVDGACPLMFLDPVRGVHRLHRALSRRRFAA